MAQSSDMRPERIRVTEAGQHPPQQGEEPSTVRTEDPFGVGSQLFTEITGAAERSLQTGAAGNRRRPEIVGQRSCHAFDTREEEREIRIDVEGGPSLTDGPVRKGTMCSPPPDRPDRRRPVLEDVQPVNRSCDGHVRHILVQGFVQQAFRRLPRCVYGYAGDERRRRDGGEGDAFEVLADG